MDCLTKPSVGILRRTYWWNPPGPEWVWIPLRQTLASVYSPPYIAFRRFTTCTQTENPVWYSHSAVTILNQHSSHLVNVFYWYRYHFCLFKVLPAFLLSTGLDRNILSFRLLYRPWVSHDSSVRKWMNLTVCSSCGPGSIPSHGGVFHRMFPWLTTLCQLVLSQRSRKWLNLPSKVPHNLWTARRKAKVQPWPDEREKIVPEACSEVEGAKN